MQPNRRGAYRAGVLSTLGDQLRAMKDEGYFKRGAVEKILAAQFGRWLVADNPARAGRVAPVAPFFNEAVRSALLELYDQDQPPPAELKELGKAFMRGARLPDERPGCGANIAVRIVVRLMVDRLKLAGWPVTRNPETEHRDTACDLVAEALGDADLSPRTYEAVRKIYYEGPFAYAEQLFKKLRKDAVLGEDFGPPAAWGNNQILVAPRAQIFFALMFASFLSETRPCDDWQCHQTENPKAPRTVGNPDFRIGFRRPGCRNSRHPPRKHMAPDPGGPDVSPTTPTAGSRAAWSSQSKTRGLNRAGFGGG